MSCDHLHFKAAPTLSGANHPQLHQLDQLTRSQTHIHPFQPRLIVVAHQPNTHRPSFPSEISTQSQFHHRPILAHSPTFNSTPYTLPP